MANVIFKIIMIRNISQLIKDMNPLIQEKKKILNVINKYKI